MAGGSRDVTGGGGRAGAARAAGSRVGGWECCDYCKFVSSKRMRKGDSRAAREHNLTLLDEGTLYVA
ncbi:hypothetical protein, partial [Streptomyces albidoflavus]